MNKILSMKPRCPKALSARISALRKNVQNLTADQSGEGYLDMAMKILIVVVIGAAILAIMNTAMPTLPPSVLQEVSSALSESHE